MEMKNNEWNVPSDYFEKNKKALMPVRKMSNRNWLLTLAAACFVGIGLFMWKGKDQTQEVAQVLLEESKQNGNEVKNEKENENVGKIKNEKQNENENESLDKRGEEKVREGKNVEDVGAKYLSPGIAEGLKEISREELVAYLLEEDSELIENLN